MASMTLLRRRLNNFNDSAAKYQRDFASYRNRFNNGYTSAIAPTVPRDAKDPGFTQQQIKQLNTGATDMAGQQLARAKGEMAPGVVAGNMVRRRNSVFAELGSNDLKNSGILARVLGGQIA